jgi:hypothetical protein
LGKKLDPEAENKRLQHLVIKDITQCRYCGFFRIRKKELEPAAGMFFYELYQGLTLAQSLMQNTLQSKLLKQLIIENFLDKDTRDCYGRLCSSSIEERAKTLSPKELSSQVQKDLSSFLAAFTKERRAAIEECHDLLVAFTQLAMFDFTHIIKQFDLTFTEQHYKPAFGRVPADYVLEDIKNFLEIAYPLQMDADWATLFKILRAFKNDTEVMNGKRWQKLLKHLLAVRDSSIFLLIIRHTEKNPVWQSSPKYPEEPIVKPYLETVRLEVDDCITRIVNARRDAQIQKLAASIFKTEDLMRMRHYTNEAGEPYLRRGLGGFLCVAELNYLKSFLINYYKKELWELCNLFVVRGQWTTQDLSRLMSEAFHGLIHLSDELLAFDKTFADDGETGSRLRTLVSKVDRDKGLVRPMKGIIVEANAAARRLSVRAVKSLIELGKQLKALYDDHNAKPHKLIINWPEIETVSVEVPIDRRINDAYRQIYNFVRLMELFIRKD